MGVCCIVFDIFAFHAISNIKKKLGVKKKFGGVDFFLEKLFFLISRFMLFSTLQKILKSAPSLTG